MAETITLKEIKELILENKIQPQALFTKEILLSDPSVILHVQKAIEEGKVPEIESAEKKKQAEDEKKAADEKKKVEDEKKKKQDDLDNEFIPDDNDRKPGDDNDLIPD